MAEVDASTVVDPEQILEPDVLDSSRAGALVLRGGVWRISGYAIGTLVSLAGVALVTRHLGVARYGQYQTVLSLITVVGAVTDAGMATLGLREYSQYSGEARDRMMATLLGLRLALTTLGILIALAIGALAGYDAQLELGVLLAGAGLALQVAQTTLAIPLNAGLRIAAVSIMDLARQLLTVAGFVILVIAGGGVAAFLAVPIPVGLVLVAACAWLVRGTIPLTPSLRPREWAKLLRATAAFAAATAAGSVYVFTAMILTSFVTSAEQTGYFAASFRVITVAAAVPGMLVTIAFPVLSRAARDDHERLAYALQRLFDASVLLGAATVLGLVTGAPLIIRIMAGPTFAPAAGVLQIQAFALFASFLLVTWGFGLLALHRHRPLLVANLAALAVSLSLVPVLAAAHGAKGSAMATVAAESVLAAGYLIALVRGHADLRPRLNSAARVMVAAAAGAIVAVIPGIATLPQTLAALVVFFVVALAVRAVPQELLELVRRTR